MISEKKYTKMKCKAFKFKSITRLIEAVSDLTLI